MQHLARFILLSVTGAALTLESRAMEGVPNPSRQTEYKRSDTNFYPKADVVKAHPAAILMPDGSFSLRDDSYLMPLRSKAPREVWLETLSDWIEPITPPGATAALPIAPDAMQIRAPQGDVQVALPSAPANFTPVTDGMPLPNGAVIKTGANGTAAVLFGGVDSARLIPNSEAAVQQTVTPQTRSAEVDLTTGGVFSKVGTQAGVKGDYEVHTPFGSAVAHGTDFATVAMPARTDVWIAQGTVELRPPDAQAETATSDGSGALKVLRFPLISDPHLSLLADAETLTAALNFIPLANQEVKALREKAAKGMILTAPEQEYLNRIKEVSSLIRLALVAPSKSPAALTPTPSAPNAAAISAPSPAAVPPASLRAVVRIDGKVNFQGVTLEPAEFKSRLEALVKTTPGQAVVIHAGKRVTYDKFKTVLDICHDAQVNVSVAAPAPTPESGGADASSVNPAPPAPSLLVHPAMEPSAVPPPADSSTPPASATNPPSPSPPTSPGP